MVTVRKICNCFQRWKAGFVQLGQIGVTFLGVLIACSRKGLVDKARWYFDHMAKQYKIMHDIKHYGCMVDVRCLLLALTH